MELRGFDLSPREIVITARNVSHFSVIGRDPDMPYSEDDCLNCVSFVGASDATEKSFMAATPRIPTFTTCFSSCLALLSGCRRKRLSAP